MIFFSSVIRFLRYNDQNLHIAFLGQMDPSKDICI